MKGLIATKVGMTQVFDESGNLTPVTVIHVEPNTVIATKTKETCGYDAVVLGVGEIKPNKANKAYKGIFPENITPKRHLKEFRDYEKEVAVGDNIGLELFNDSRFLDVTATSKGKGFQGVVKRHGFAGVGGATHGQHNRLRHPGSMGASSWPSRVFPGMRMAGHTGDARVKVQNLQVVKVLPESNLIVVKGSVPGAKGSYVIVEA